MTGDSPEEIEALSSVLQRRAEELAPRLIGLTEDEARSLAAAAGCSIRLAERDGEEFVLRADYRPGRITAVVTEGRIATAEARG
jgi:hypothetical protein